MDNQLVKSEILLQRVGLMALAVVLAILMGVVSFHLFRASDPYIHSVLSVAGDPVRGQAMFEMNCAGCHGLQAQGRVGPSLGNISRRKSRVNIIDQVIGGKTPPMPQFQPSSQEMADLLSYLEKL